MFEEIFLADILRKPIMLKSSKIWFNDTTGIFASSTFPERNWGNDGFAVVISGDIELMMIVSVSEILGYYLSGHWWYLL